MCAVSPVVHTSNISSCKKKLSQFSCGCEQFHWGRSFGFLVINVCNHGEHYETPRTIDMLPVNKRTDHARLQGHVTWGTGTALCFYLLRICTYHFDSYMLVVVQVLPCKQERKSTINDAQLTSHLKMRIQFFHRSTLLTRSTGKWISERWTTTENIFFPKLFLILTRT
jgi:hypothetical protein